MFEEYNDVLRVEEAAKALRIGRNAAYDLIKSGEIKYKRIGKQILIPKVYLIDYILSDCYTKDSSGGKERR